MITQSNSLAVAEPTWGLSNRLPGRGVLVLFAIAALTLGLISATGGSAAAIDEWDNPVTVDSTVRSGGVIPTVALSKDGSKALAVWRARPTGGGNVYAAWWTPSGWSPVATLGSGGSDTERTPSVALSADGSNAVVVWDRADEDDPVPSYYSVQWARWTGAGWTPQTTLTADAAGSSVSMSADAATTVASWVSSAGQVKTSTMAGAVWQAPQTVATPFSNVADTDVSVAAKASGEAMLSWRQKDSASSGTSRVASAHLSSGVWSAVWLGPKSDAVLAPSMELSDNGSRAFLIWPYRKTSLSDAKLRAAVWKSGTWGSAQKLGKPTIDGSVAHLGLAASSSGKKAYAMWTTRSAGKSVITSSRWRKGSWSSSAKAGKGVNPQVGLAGGEATALWRGEWNAEHSVRTKVTSGSSWQAYQKIGKASAWQPVSFALAGDGATGMAVWSQGGRVKASLLQRYGKAKKVKAKVSKKSKAKITWKQPSYATGAKVKLSKPNKKKFSSWKTVSKPKYAKTVKRGKKYWVKIKVTTPAGQGPAVTKSFQS